MNGLPPLDELLGRVNSSSQYVFVPIDRWATAKIFEMDPIANVCEVQTFTSSYVIDDYCPVENIAKPIQDILVPSANVIYRDNPNCHLVFCYTIENSGSRSNQIPLYINQFLPGITSKRILYINEKDSDNDIPTLQRLLGGVYRPTPVKPVVEKREPTAEEVRERKDFEWRSKQDREKREWREENGLDLVLAIWDWMKS